MKTYISVKKIPKILLINLTIVICLLNIACNRTDHGSVVEASHRTQATSSYDTALLLSSLEVIKDFHTRSKSKLQLNAPATREQLDQLERVVGCKLPQEALALWQWHNGEKTEAFVWYHRFLSIEESIEEYLLLTKASWSDWNKSWIPIFEFQEEWYGIECNVSEAEATPVVYYFIEAGASVAYNNLTTYMATMATAIEKRAIWREGEFWEDDISALAFIHQNKNAEVRFPYGVTK